MYATQTTIVVYATQTTTFVKNGSVAAVCVKRSPLHTVGFSRQSTDGDLMDDSDHEMAPPRQRPRLLPPLPVSTAMPDTVVDEDYTPTSPPSAAATPTAAAAVVPAAADTAAAETQPQATASVELPHVPSTLDSLSEPSEEPPIPSTGATPHAPLPPTADSASDPPPLDPRTAALYKAPSRPETFQERRARINQQETLSFAPVRQRSMSTVAPYDPSTRPTSSTDDAITGRAFYLEDLDTSALPSGWHMDEHGFLQLNNRSTDYWELRAGCLIRHHVVPRRGRLPIAQGSCDSSTRIEGQGQALHR